MPDRNMADPRSAFAWTLTDIQRDIQIMQSRQHWPGRTQIIDQAAVPGTVRTSFGTAIGDFMAIGLVQLAAGAWIAHGRVIFSIQNHAAAAYYTGQEAAQVRVYAANPDTLEVYEEIDLAYAQPSATPTGTYSTGWLDLPIPIVGYTRQDEPFAMLVIAQAWDSAGATPCFWTTKMVVVPA